MKVFSALIFSSFAGVALAAALTYSDAKALADRDEASLGSSSGALVEAQGTVLGPLLADCARSIGGADQSSFVVVMELDASGRIVKTWRQGSSPISACFESSVMGKSLVSPPKAPFYTSFEMHFTN
jgi:hypothetical protein